mgnify:CR=1 FL=1
MCGIFGVIAKENSGLNVKSFKRSLNDLLLVFESRGQEAEEKDHLKTS